MDARHPLDNQPRIDVAGLLRLDEGLVHSDVYASPAVFALEMEKIFHQGWVYVGHESEVPKPGDFVTRWIGTQSVILCRDDQSKIRLLMNRCRHRANFICQAEQGNAPVFRCPYHGWTYKTSGELLGASSKEGAYSADFDNAALGLVAPRMEIYRGFVWGNLGADGISFDEHLGPGGKKSIDLFCDASPEGEIILRQGVLKGVIHANWKFQGGDGYHTSFVHHANFMYMRAKRAGDNRNPLAAMGKVEEGWLSRDLGRGHYSLDIRALQRDKLPDTAWARDYRAKMTKAYGAERADFIIRTGGNPHAVLMPNLQLVNYDVRVLRPLTVDRFENYFYCAFLKGAPDELNELRLRDTEDRMGAAGCINPDDVDMFERNQLGLSQTVEPWKYMARGLGRETMNDDATAPEAYRMTGTRTGHFTDELTQRAQLRWWAEQLTRP